VKYFKVTEFLNFIEPAFPVMSRKMKLKRYEVFGPHADIWGKDLIFIHVPKAAGSSVGRLNVGRTYGHQTYSFYEKWLPKGRKMPVTFSIVRCPYDRCVSAFNYLKKSSRSPLDLWWSRNHLSEFDDVNEFVVNRLERRDILDWMHFRPQVDFLKGSNGEISVDFVMKLEELTSSWPIFSEKFGLPAEIERINISRKSTRALSDEAARVIEDVYSDDFALLGYDVRESVSKKGMLK
jgi:hypothetical protein